MLILCEGGPGAKSGTAGPIRGGSNFMQRGTGPYGGMLILIPCKQQTVLSMYLMIDTLGFHTLNQLSTNSRQADWRTKFV